MEEFETDAIVRRVRFLSPTQFESLARLSEGIIPGANKAQAAEFIDLLLSVEAVKEQKEFDDSLSAFEAESKKRYGKKLAAIASRALFALPCFSFGEVIARATDSALAPSPACGGAAFIAVCS